MRAAVSEITDQSNAPDGKSIPIPKLPLTSLPHLTQLTPTCSCHPAFALYGLVWIVGSILGNAIGGYLSHPVERYPDIFARGGSLEAHPYLLPCLVTTGITLAGLLFTALLMEEVSRRQDTYTPDVL